MANGRIGTVVLGPNQEKFRLDSFIGGGAFGEVYRASGLTSGSTVAVKMAPEGKLSDPTTLAFRTVLNETQAEMLKVNHPNVVRVLYADPGTDPKLGPYVVMEYVDGGNLQELLAERSRVSKRFTLDEAVALMGGIVLGAQAINEHLIHRDIKPDNILLDGHADALRPRIADFGIAKVALEMTRPETFKGIQSIWYMAPEVWRNEKHTPKIDVYSVGLVFYQILTLEHPLLAFVSDSWDLIKWRTAHLYELCPDVRSTRDDVPLSWARLLLRMTDKSARNRPDWNKVLDSLDPSTAQPAKRVDLDPRLVAAFKQHADEGLREERERSRAELERQRKAEIDAARREEYMRSATRLLNQFDETIEALNEQEPAYAIQLQGVPPPGGESLMRSYVLPNNRRVECLFSGYAGGMQSPRGPILGGGYIGIAGALSANAVLLGQADDIASANWSAVEATVMALIAGNSRLKWYQEAGLTDEDIRFQEHINRDSWARDAATHFGFKEIGRFFNEFIRGIRAMHVYSFNVTPDPMHSFTEILMLGLRMPRLGQ
jgi:serine/threonine protein kinase